MRYLRTDWHRVGGWTWRAGITREICLGLGVRYDLAPDVWVVTLLCFALVFGRRQVTITHREAS